MINLGKKVKNTPQIYVLFQTFDFVSLCPITNKMLSMKPGMAALEYMSHSFNSRWAIMKGNTRRNVKQWNTTNSIPINEQDFGNVRLALHWCMQI